MTTSRQTAHPVSFHRTGLFRTAALSLCVVALAGLRASTAAAAPPAGEPAFAAGTSRRLQALVDELRASLALEHDVRVTIVNENPLLVSVKAHHGQPFELAFEGRFLSELTETELRAVVAHELGHVWIFTHHPFLQTEELANRIAQRVVSREDLEQVYQKVWARDGRKGDLARFLGRAPHIDAQTGR